MKFCSECGQPVTLKIPPDDNQLRFVCVSCQTVHYQNPKLVVGTLPIWRQDNETKILLCRRAIEPRYGRWTLPAGFMENGETVAQAAMRETTEEAGAHIALQELFSMLSVVHVNQVHLFYRATLLDLNFAPGTESLEVALFREDEIPWDDIAFRTSFYTLKFFFSELGKPPSTVYCHDILTPRTTG